MESVGGAGGRGYGRQQQLFVVHRLPETTRLVRAPAEPTAASYTDVWNAATKLSRSRRVVAAESASASEPSRRRHRASESQRTASDQWNRNRIGRTMRVDNSELVESRDSGRRTSNTGSELGDWINKYQKSDHHADRLARTIVQYEQTTGQRFPDSKLIPANYYEIKRNHVSALPDVVYVKTSATESQPVSYDLPRGPVRRSSVDVGSAHYGEHGVSIHLQPSTVSTRRPPAVPRSPATEHISRAASLPPASADTLYRRRQSISAAYNGRPTALQRYTSPGPGAAGILPSIRQGEPVLTAPALGVPGYRRASYSGASAGYNGVARPYLSVTEASSRHATPDRVIDEELGRSLLSSTGRRPSISGLSTGNWSARSRSASPGLVNNYYLLPTAAAVPMSDARRKIRRVLNKVSADE